MTGFVESVVVATGFSRLNGMSESLGKCNKLQHSFESRVDVISTSGCSLLNIPVRFPNYTHLTVRRELSKNFLLRIQGGRLRFLVVARFGLVFRWSIEGAGSDLFYGIAVRLAVQLYIGGLVAKDLLVFSCLWQNNYI